MNHEKDYPYPGASLSIRYLQFRFLVFNFIARFSLKRCQGRKHNAGAEYPGSTGPNPVKSAGLWCQKISAKIRMSCDAIHSSKIHTTGWFAPKQSIGNLSLSKIQK